MNLRYDTGWNPPRSAYFGDGPIPTWDVNDVPDFIRYADNALDEDQKWQNSGTTFIELIKGIGGSIPFIGNLFNAVGNIALNAWHRGDVKIANQRRKLESRYADWYNSPLQQLKRARKAGINPFMQSYVKSIPHEMPQVETVPNQGFSMPSESLAGLINAFTNAKVAQHRIDNLDSLTAINEYKEQNLLPQLFDKNGYINSILGLQVAWETKNYEYERQLKQNILDANYELALLDTAQGLMETSVMIPGSYVNVDVKRGTLVVDIPDENGVMQQFDLNNLPFDKLPPVLQKSLIDVWQTKQITNSKVQLNTITGNTQSALGGLYNSQKHKVDIYCNTYDATGVWPDEDITLRYAAGILGSKTYWSNWGLNSLDKVFETGLDVGSLYLNPKTTLQRTGTTVPHEIPQSPVLTPQPLNIPRGAKPYTFKGQTYWYYPK